MSRWTSTSSAPRPIRLEFVREARIELSGGVDASLGVAVLTHDDLFAEKLLANADRYLDSATSCRDAIDLAMMTRAWGPAPTASWRRARGAYGDTVDRALAGAIQRLRDDGYRTAASRQLAMDITLGPGVLSALEQLQSTAAPSRKTATLGITSASAAMAIAAVDYVTQ